MLILRFHSIQSCLRSRWLRTLVAASFLGIGLAVAQPISMVDAATQPALAPANGQFVSISPYVVLDTTTGVGEVSAQSLGAGVTVNVSVVGSDGVPSTASAVVVNIYVRSPSTAGYISDNSSNDFDTGAPSLGFRQESNTSQTEVIQVGADGEIYLTNHSSGSTDMNVTVLGYYTGPAASSAGDTYTGVPWAEIADTTTGVGTSETPIPANGSRTIQVTGEGGVAAGADAAVIQVNGFNASQAGALDVYPAGTADPGIPTLRYHSDDEYRTIFYASLSSSGQVTITNNGSAAVDITVWVRGYFMPPSTTQAGDEFTASDPQMVYGTASAGVSLAGGASVSFQVTGTGQIPSSGVAEVAEDIAVTSPTATGTLKVGAAGSTTHDVINFLAGDSTDVGGDNTVLTAISPTGQETITNSSSGTVDLQVAVRGYYLAPSVPQAPASVTVTTSGTSATVKWAVPASDGGSPISGYTITASPDSSQVTVDPGTLQATLTGLANAAGDSFTVTATNAVGHSPGSAYQPITPATVEDTVSNGSPIASGATDTIAVGGTNGLPTYGVGEAALNVTVENEATAGSVTLTPAGMSLPDPSQAFSAGTSSSSLLFVPTGSEGDISLSNSSSGSIDVVVQLVGWSAASAVIPTAQQANFLSSAEALGTDADTANQAIYNESLAAGIAVSVTSDTPDDSPGTFASPDIPVSTPMTDATSGTDAGSVNSPGIPVSYSSGSFDTQAPALSRCPSGSSMAEHSKTVKSYNILGLLMYSTTFHKVWCYNGTKVTGIIKVNVIPNTTNFGAAGGWQYDGLVSGTSDDYYYNNSAGPNTGHHSFREAHWHLCPATKLSCFDNTYDKMNMNVFMIGTAAFYGGNDHL
jgi:hypothetical protein